MLRWLSRRITAPGAVFLRTSEQSKTVKPRRRFALVYNATAGIAFPRLLDGVLAGLRGAGAEVFQLPARSAIEAADRVREAAIAGVCDVVLSAGGDGTFRAVATGAAGADLPIGVIPLGTGNVIASELGLPRRAAPLADILATAPAIDVQGALVNEEPFFLMCSAGFDGKIVASLSYSAKRAVGRLAYARPVIDAIADGPESFDVLVDENPMRASWVIVTLARRYGGKFELTRETGLGSANMIAVLIDATTRRQLAAAAVALATGRIADPARRPGFVRVLAADTIEIGLRQTAPVEIDGDAAGMTPISVRRSGPSVRVIAPPGYSLVQRC